MDPDHSLHFFDQQFRRQLASHEFALNPFEQAALPHLRGDVLDYGCGLGNLALAAARQGCHVTAWDGSAAAIEHITRSAAAEGLPVQACCADLRAQRVEGCYDTVVCIGLLMFFDCPSAWRQLQQLQAAVRAAGVLVLNVLVQGTTYLDMFAPDGHCLFDASALRQAFAGWELLHDDTQRFDAPQGTHKLFVTLVARKPAR